MIAQTCARRCDGVHESSAGGGSSPIRYTLSVTLRRDMIALYHGSPTPAMSKLHHIGIAVKDLQQASATWSALLGVECGPPCDVPEEGVKIAFLRAGSPKIELLEPLGPESVIAKFIDKRGEGIHHVAFAVPDIRAAMARLEAQGVPVLDAEPRFRGGNRWAAFCHPKGANGVLTELVQYLTPEAEEAGY